MGSKTGKELPDLSIHPPLSLIHLGEGRTDNKNRWAKRRPWSSALPQAAPAPSSSPTWATYAPVLMSATLSVCPSPSHS